MPNKNTEHPVIYTISQKGTKWEILDAQGRAIIPNITSETNAYIGLALLKYSYLNEKINNTAKENH